MATTTKKSTTKKAPTPKQVAARKKFAEMAKARARAKASKEISKLRHEGYPEKQAVAVGMKKAGIARKKNPRATECHYVVAVDDSGKVKGYFDGFGFETSKEKAASYKTANVAAAVALKIAHSTKGNYAVGVLSEGK